MSIKLLLFVLTLLADVGMPVASWLAIGIALILGAMGWMIKGIYGDLKARVLALEEKNDKLEAKVGELHIIILGKLDEIKDKFNEFRK